jgi:hypothetical protein
MMIFIVHALYLSGTEWPGDPAKIRSTLWRVPSSATH